jgi:hypothetical protein
VQAEIQALPMIAEHKAKLLEARPRIETAWRHEYEPGREHVRPDGERVAMVANTLMTSRARWALTGSAIRPCCRTVRMGPVCVPDRTAARLTWPTPERLGPFGQNTALQNPWQPSDGFRP